jgi:hypothetical protein
MRWGLMDILILLLCRLAGIGELKMFVGLCKDRAAGLSVAPAVTLQRHTRTLYLLLLVLAADAAGWLLLLWQYQQRQLSRGVCLLFGLDLAVTAVDAAKATLRWVEMTFGPRLCCRTELSILEGMHYMCCLLLSCYAMLMLLSVLVHCTGESILLLHLHVAFPGVAVALACSLMRP